RQGSIDRNLTIYQEVDLRSAMYQICNPEPRLGQVICACARLFVDLGGRQAGYCQGTKHSQQVSVLLHLYPFTSVRWKHSADRRHTSPPPCLPQGYSVRSSRDALPALEVQRNCGWAPSGTLCQTWAVKM